MDNKPNEFRADAKLVFRLFMVVFSMIGIFTCIMLIVLIDPDFSTFNSNSNTDAYVAANQEEDWDKIENGIHLRTGLIEAEGLMETVTNCTTCHSAKLVTQNRMNKERWAVTIDWMQETQNLWDLGKNEEIIINYLVANYPVTAKGRRQTFTNIDWYELED